MSWLGKLLISLASMLIITMLVLGGICIFVKVKYDVNVISTFMQVKSLMKDVNADEKFKEQFTDSDKQSAMETINAKIANLITYTETDGYNINESVSSELTSDLKLTSKQVGAVMSMLMPQNDSGLSIAGQLVTLELVQIDFPSVESDKADFNVVVRADISGIKGEMNFFPMSIFAKYIPNNIYISSTVTIIKGENSFEYTIQSKTLEINQLDGKGTQELLTTINKLFEFGTVESLNEQLGNVFVNGLIGNAEMSGFTYSLKNIGVKDYNFETVDNVNFYVLKA